MGRGLWLGGALLAVWSCGSDDHSTTPNDGVGPEGGTIELSDGASIRLPAGAVPEGVKVMADIVEDSAAPPSGLQVMGKVYAFLPHGTHFEKPVTISIPASRAANGVFTLDDDDDTSWQQVPSTTAENGFHSIRVDHISLFAELEPLDGTAGAGGGGGMSTGGDGSGGMAGDGAAGQGGAAGAGQAGADAGTAVVPRRICAGYSHGCAVVDDGKIVCWGSGEAGQLGDGVIHAEEPYGRSNAALVPGIDTADQIACNNTSVSALLADGTVLTWGRVGDGAPTPQVATPKPVAITSVKQISAGGEHVCALLANKTVSCWGRSDFGQLGDGSANTPGSASRADTPQTVPGLGEVLEVETGAYHTCAVLADRTIKCWGDNGHGQLGAPSPATSSTPLAVPGLEDVVHLALGTDFSCALLGSGAVACWGLGGSGQLGDGEDRPVDTWTSTPVNVASASATKWLVARFAHVCLIDGANRVRCWGSGSQGELGDGVFHQEPPHATSPQTTVMLEGAEDLGLGTDTSCARLHDQSLWCWGYAVYGALGSGVVYPIPVYNFPQPPSHTVDEIASAVPVKVVRAP